MKTGETDILLLLADQEEALSRLYETLSVVLHDMESFWSKLAEEEHTHAKLFGTIRKLALAGKVDLKRDVFRPAALRQVIAYLDRKTAEIIRSGTTAHRALSLAIDIERSLVEKSGFSVLEPNNARVRDMLDSLDRHTQKHIARLEKRLAAESASGK